MARRLEVISNHLGEKPNAVGKALKTQYVKDPIKFMGLEDLIPAGLNSKRMQLREVLDRDIAPLLPEFIEKAQFPREILGKIKGLFGLSEAKYGCRQVTPREKSITLYELARVDTSLATFYALTMSLVIYTIEALGSEEQKAKYLPGLCNLDLIGCWGLTEPNFGSDASGLQTTATPVDGGFVLNGSKRWIGNAIISDIMVIWAKNTKTNKIEGFVIPSKTPGIHVKNIDRKLGLRMVQNGEITLTDVKVPITTRLEKATNFGNGVKVVLEHSRVSIAWIATGMLSGVYEASVKHLRERMQFGVPIGAFQLNQEKLVRILGHYHSCFLLAWRITELQEQGKATSGQAGLIKAITSLIGRDAVRLGREMLGGDGILIDNYVMKALADMEIVYTYEGTYDINALVAGEAITGISAFKSSYRPRKN